MNHLLNSFSRLSVWAGGFLVSYKENGSCGRYGNAPDCGSGLCGFKSRRPPSAKRRTKRNYPVINPVETGRRINRLRKSKGLSVPYLRDYFGFSTTNAIYKWLRGDTLPSLDNMFALSLLLGESVNDILVAECGDERTAG